MENTLRFETKKKLRDKNNLIFFLYVKTFYFILKKKLGSLGTKTK
jgi:hypothetical protein